MIAAALREQPARRIAAAAEVWREQPFAYPAGEQLPLLTGVIDLLAGERRRRLSGARLQERPGRRGGGSRGAGGARLRAAARAVRARGAARRAPSAWRSQHWFLARPREWASARFRRPSCGALQASLAGAPAERAAGGLRRQPAAPPRAVRELPGTLAPVLLAGERDDGPGAPARAAAARGVTARRRRRPNGPCQLV